MRRKFTFKMEIELFFRPVRFLEVFLVLNEFSEKIHAIYIRFIHVYCNYNIRILFLSSYCEMP